MEVIEEISDISKLKSNKISGEIPEIINSKIIFSGEDNILYCSKNVKLDNCNIIFNGSNSVVYLSSSYHEYKIDINIFNNSVLYFGNNNYINDKIKMIISEEKNIIIGNTGLFSFELWMRVADAHAIYGCKDNKRVNPSKSIYIGDHVWIGQSCLILKGTQIGSGSIIAGRSVVTGKTIKSNTCWGGNPAKEIYKDIYFGSACVNEWTSTEEYENKYFNTESPIFEDISEEKFSFNDIENDLKRIKDSHNKVEYLNEKMVKNNKKNRFFI